MEKEKSGKLEKSTEKKGMNRREILAGYRWGFGGSSCGDR